MRIRVTLLAALLAWLALPALPAGAVPAAPDFALSAVLKRAMAEGPGFAAAALQRRLRASADEADGARGLPAAVFSSRTRLSPAPGHALSGTLTWRPTDDLSVDVSVEAAPEFGGTFAVGFSRVLWPPGEGDLAEEQRALANRVARRRAEDESFAAMMDVVRAFYTLRDALYGVAVAEQALVVASNRAVVAEDRFEAGEAGLAEWQSALRAQRQAQLDVRTSRTALEQAAERLTRLTFAAGESTPDDPLLVEKMPGNLVDDLQWTELRAVVEAALANGHDAAEDLFLANDAAYLEAVRAELEQALTVADAENATRVRWRAVIEYALPFGSAAGAGETGGAAPGAPAGASDSGSGPGAGSRSGPTPSPTVAGRGDLAAYVVATVDLGAENRVRLERAEASLELARLRTEQARHAAVDAGVAALRAAEDAAFALEMAVEGLEQAVTTVALAERRIELGFAARPEMEEARLELLRAERDVARAEGELRMAWLELAHRLGVRPLVVLGLVPDGERR